MSNQYYRKSTIQDALVVANNIRYEDRREVEGLGHSLVGLPYCVLASSHCVTFHDLNGEIGGIAGIIPTGEEGVGQIWMLCTPILTRKPHTFVRQAKRWLESQHDYTLLWNYADCRNVFHHKLLKLLGFRALRVVYPAPFYLPYLEIVKLCA